MKYLKKFESYQNPYYVEEEIMEDIKSSTSMEELKDKVEKYNLNKGQLMYIAYDGNTRGVDSAIPSNVWSKLEEYGGTDWFVMDYQNKSHGKLVHLGEKILDKKLTNWNKKLEKPE